MGIKTMTRAAADNKYLHRDFHVSTDIGINYIGTHYGNEGVVEYLRRYATSFLSPLVEEIKKDGLVALKRYFEDLYMQEEMPEVLHTVLSDGLLEVTIDRCPAVTFMRKSGHTPSKWYIETVNTVYKTVAEATGIGFELLYYHTEDGSSSYRFFL